jgi:hypothetical protein
MRAINGILESESSALCSTKNSKSLAANMPHWNQDPLEEDDEGKRVAFLKNTVRHMRLFMFPATASPSIRIPISRILRLNPNLFELLIEDYSSPVAGTRMLSRLPLLVELRPTRVTVQFDRDDHLVAVNLSEPLFSSATHITLLNTAMKHRNPETWAYWSQGLPALRTLTHLCVTDNIAEAIMPQLLIACPHLQAVVAFFWTEPIPWFERQPALGVEMARKLDLAAARCRTRMTAFEQRISAMPDLRVVLVAVPDFYEAWELGVRSGHDMWTEVEAFIARKRRGELDGMCFCVHGGRLYSCSQLRDQVHT